MSANAAIEFRTCKPGDEKQIAALHAAVFPDYFLTHLGRHVLERYYRQYQDPPGVIAVAVKEGRIIGVVAGALDGAQFYRAFYATYFLFLGCTICRKMISDRIIWSGVWNRVSHIRLALSAVMQRFSSKAKLIETKYNETRARLFSIAVSPEERGKDVADQMTAFFCNLMRQKGVTSIGSTCFSFNKSAISFFRKAGWVPLAQKGNTVVFRKDF